MDLVHQIAAGIPLKILFCSYVFPPSVGGIETVGRLLVEEFAAAGHDVRVVTETANAACGTIPVVSRPGRRVLMQQAGWADVVFHNNISLRYAWPVIFARKPWVIAHHTWLTKPNGARGLAERIKEFCTRRAKNIAVSTAIAQALPAKAAVIPNPYDAATFYVRKNVERERDLVFVGRLVSDKGVDVLLEALRLAKERGFRSTLSIVGAGPERANLERQAEAGGIREQVIFHGERSGVELAELLNAHKILVVPSRWNEPFGVVALEAIACGCRVIGTSGGGLPEAIGPCGVMVPNGDAKALSEAIIECLSGENAMSSQAVAEGHLKKHHPITVAERYLAVLEQAR